MKELQRRLDQTLGKPGSYHHGMDREGHIKPMTIGVRLYRLENQVNIFSLVNMPFIENLKIKVMLILFSERLIFGGAFSGWTC